MEAGREHLAQQRVVPYVESHELSVVHDVIKRITRPVIRENFWHEKPFWGLVINNMRAKKHEEHVVQSPTNGVDIFANVVSHRQRQC